MSEHKTTTDLIAETEYEISRYEAKQKDYLQKALNMSYKIINLEERRKSLLSYLNTDSDSINQDKTE